MVSSEAGQLQEYLGHLPKTAWQRPSACDRWTVADVVAHLAWAAEYFMATISDGIKGDVSLPGDWPARGALSPAGFAELSPKKRLRRGRTWETGWRRPRLRPLPP